MKTSVKTNSHNLRDSGTSTSHEYPESYINMSTDTKECPFRMSHFSHFPFPYTPFQTPLVRVRRLSQRVISVCRVRINEVIAQHCHEHFTIDGPLE